MTYPSSSDGVALVEARLAPLAFLHQLAQVLYRICVRVIVGNYRTPCGQEVPGERETDVTPGAGDQDSGFQHQMAHPNGWMLALRPIR